MQITILGGGVMGQAIAQALLKQKVLLPAKLTVTDPDLSKLAELQNLGANISSDNLTAVQSADVVLLAVKPQVMTKVLTPLQNNILSKTMVISIAAGITISTIQTILKHKTIVRVMPNTPLLIGKGMSGWFSDKSVTTEQKTQVKQILNACGQEIEVDQEDAIDIITALSGSGPAYVFLFLQSLISGAVQLGLTKKQAKRAALQTVLGGVKLAQNSTQDLQTLIQNVTSKGGTTEAALAYFASAGFEDTVINAMQTAYQRAKELAQK